MKCSKCHKDIPFNKPVQSLMQSNIGDIFCSVDCITYSEDYLTCKELSTTLGASAGALSKELWEESRQDGFTFNPWDDKKLEGRKPFASVTDIVNAPPCVKCKHWNPVTDGDEVEEHRGIILCHKENTRRHNDFSCYEKEL